MEAKFRIGEKVKIANHPDKSKIGKEVEIINLHHSNFNPQKGYVAVCREIGRTRQRYSTTF